MNVKEENICRLCLKVAEKGFEVNDVMRQMFDILVIKLDLGITRNPTICQNCMEVARKCLSFKCTCIYTETIILSYLVDRNKVEDNIKVINEGTKHVRIVFDEDFNICRFCMNRLERNNFGSLDVLISERVLQILSKFIREVDFCTIEKTIICANCRINLKDYFKFVLNCVNVEDKIKTYCEKNGTDSTGQVKLSSILFFPSTYVLEYPNKCSPTLKIERGHIECADVKARSALIKQEELDIKDEETILNRDCCRLSPPREYYSETKSDMICSGTKEHNTEEHIDKYDVQFRSAGDSSLHENVLKVKTIESSVVEIINKHAMGTDETREKRNCQNHLNNYTDILEPDIHEDILCTSEIKIESVSKDHMSNTEGVLEHEERPTLIQMDTSDLQSYISVDIDHKNISKIKVFKCSLCAYRSKRKNHVKTHMLVHKSPSEREIFQCSLCSYEARQKRTLKSHMLMVHTKDYEIEMYKCSLCAHKTKSKYSLKTHMLVHEDVSEIQMFECSLCVFKSKRRSSLRRHMLGHRDVSEIQLYKCSLCAYEFKRKCSLKRHMWETMGRCAL